MTKMSFVGLAVGLAAAITLGGSRPHALAQQNEQAIQYRARTIALFKELMQLKRQEIIVFSIFESGAGGRGFGADNPRAYNWAQRARRHVEQAPRGVSCWAADQPLGLFLSVCDNELLSFIGVGADRFNVMATRFWLLTLCTENPQGCQP